MFSPLRRSIFPIHFEISLNLWIFRRQSKSIDVSFIVYFYGFPCILSTHFRYFLRNQIKRIWTDRMNWIHKTETTTRGQWWNSRGYKLYFHLQNLQINRCFQFFKMYWVFYLTRSFVRFETFSRNLIWTPLR